MKGFVNCGSQGRISADKIDTKHQPGAPKKLNPRFWQDSDFPTSCVSTERNTESSLYYASEKGPRQVKGHKTAVLSKGITLSGCTKWPEIKEIKKKKWKKRVEKGGKGLNRLGREALQMLQEVAQTVPNNLKLGLFLFFRLFSCVYLSFHRESEMKWRATAYGETF